MRAPSLPHAFAAALAGVALLAAAARADVEVDVRLGHGGSWVQSAATPVVVELRGRGGPAVEVRLQIRTGDMLGQGEVVHERTVLLGPDVVRREVFLLPGPEFVVGPVVEVRTSPSVPIRSGTKFADRGRLEILTTPVASVQPIGYECHVLGVVNDRRNVLGTSLHHAARETVQFGGLSVVREDEIHVLHASPECLALGPHGLDGIETLVVCDPDGSFAADPRDAEALLDWVALGGNLVVSLGENAASFATSPLAAELPARWLGADVGDALSIALDLGVPRPDATASRPAALVRLAPDARAAPFGAEFPADLVAARSFGGGRIAVLGFDVRAVLEVLPPERDFVRPVLGALLFEEADRAPTSEAQPWEQTYDVAATLGQLLQGASFRPPPLPLVLLGLCAYVVVVGPLDWLILRRMKKERWTTLTFAGAVVAFTLVAYGMSFALFTAEASVNRVAFVHLTSGGRDGRELVRVRDLAGHYAPTGDTRICAFTLPAAIVGSSLPGLRESGGVGAKDPVVVHGNDPIAPRAVVDIAFRSQRVVSSLVAGATGRTLDATATVAKDDLALDVSNGLPCDLEAAWVFLPDGRSVTIGRIAAGHAGTVRGRLLPAGRGDLDDPRPTNPSVHEAATVRPWLGRIAAASMLEGPRPAGFHALRRAGIVAPKPPPGRALLVALAGGSPVPLPADDLGGARYVVVTKEVDLR